MLQLISGAFWPHCTSQEEQLPRRATSGGFDHDGVLAGDAADQPSWRLVTRRNPALLENSYGPLPLALSEQI
jgi:hypothetical protein